MAQRRKILTREELYARYSRLTGCSVPRAAQMHHGTDIEDFRAIVETLEGHTMLRGRRVSFARSQPTTSIQGETR